MKILIFKPHWAGLYCEDMMLQGLSPYLKDGNIEVTILAEMSDLHNFRRDHLLYKEQNVRYGKSFKLLNINLLFKHHDNFPLYYNIDLKNLDYIAEKFLRIIGNTKYDIVLSNSHHPYVKIFQTRVFPNTPILFWENGFAAQPPYHFCLSFDILGCDSTSFLRYYLNSQEVLKKEEDYTKIKDFCDKYCSVIANAIKYNPELINDILEFKSRKQFAKYALLPLSIQYDYQLTMSYNDPSKLNVLTHVLENLDPSIGLFVTEHHIQPDPNYDLSSFPEYVEYLRLRYPNFLYKPSWNHIKYISQNFYPHIDAVITTNSAVGMQFALQYKKPICVLGNSRISTFANCKTVSTLNKILLDDKYIVPIEEAYFDDKLTVTNEQDRNKLLYYLLTHYYIPIHNSQWFFSFLSRCIKNYHTHSVKPTLDNANQHYLSFSNFYERIATDDEILQVLLSDAERIIKQHQSPLYTIKKLSKKILAY